MSTRPILSSSAQKAGLPALVAPGARVLVLGTLPGDISLSRGEYYANERNQFWRILERVFGESPGDTYETRRAFLARHGIALWDVLASARRDGSLDARIRAAQPNDIAGFVVGLPSLRAIALNGRKAAELFERHQGRGTLEAAGVRLHTLPSTSPVPGRNVLSLEEKVQRWRVIRDT